MAVQRSSFTNRLGFVLAAAGSAVGLGNIWRFPYLAAKYGGGIFLLVYLVLAVSFGFTLMIAEISIGRKTGLSAVGAYKALDKRFSFLGGLSSLVPMIIFPYYCVIGGWVVKYFTAFITGNGAAAAGQDYFNTFISQPAQPVLWLVVFVVVTAAVVMAGVEKGVEKVSRILMPVLVVLSVVIAVYCMTLPGAADGIKYYLLPDFSKFSIKTVLAALGQLFYSMSLSMGIMITYGSYMKKEADIEKSVTQIELFDTGIAFVSGLMVIPAVFAFMGPDAVGTGPSLMFVTLPRVFNSMSFGSVVGIVFFVLVLFAALTSSISLMETVVSIVQDKLKWKRVPATLTVMAVSLLIAVPVSLGFGVWSWIQVLGMNLLDFFDFISNSVMMPVVALLTCVFVGFFIKPQTIVDEVKSSSKFGREKIFRVMIKWIAPVCILAILITSVLSTFTDYQL